MNANGYFFTKKLLPFIMLMRFFYSVMVLCGCVFCMLCFVLVFCGWCVFHSLCPPFFPSPGNVQLINVITFYYNWLWCTCIRFCFTTSSYEANACHSPPELFSSPVLYFLVLVMTHVNGAIHRNISWYRGSSSSGVQEHLNFGLHWNCIDR